MQLLTQCSSPKRNRNKKADKQSKLWTQFSDGLAKSLSLVFHPSGALACAAELAQLTPV